MTEYEQGVRDGVEALGFYFKDENERCFLSDFSDPDKVLEEFQEGAIDEVLRTKELSDRY